MGKKQKKIAACGATWSDDEKRKNTAACAARWSDDHSLDLATLAAWDDPGQRFDILKLNKILKESATEGLGTAIKVTQSSAFEIQDAEKI